MHKETPKVLNPKIGGYEDKTKTLDKKKIYKEYREALNIKLEGMKTRKRQIYKVTPKALTLKLEGMKTRQRH